MTPDDHDLGAHTTTDTHRANGTHNPPPSGWAEADGLLAIFADAVDDLERIRIATQNRVRSLAQVKGLEGSAEQARFECLADAISQLEHQAVLGLQGAMRKHPLGPWVKATTGVGERQAARLLAAIGDPYIRPALYGENGDLLADPQRRTVSQLWAYCGYHVLSADSTDDSCDPGRSAPNTQVGSAGVAPKRRRGQKANWNANARVRAYLIAESCMKKRNSPFRDVYDLRRQHTAETHPEWTVGHSHNDALRVVAKEVLKNLWRESRRLHGEAAA